MLLIKNAQLRTMVGEGLREGCILIGDDGKLAAVGETLRAPAGAEVLDAGGRLVTPGLVDAHTHIGLHGTAIHWEGMEVNEKTDPLVPHMRAEDSFNPADEALPEALQGGVTTACACPGSSDVVGGTAAVVKLAGNDVEQMLLKAPAAMKCAFGENPKKVYGNKNKQPITRMAIAALLRDLLIRSRVYYEEKQAGKAPKYDARLEAMLPVMAGQIPLKCHAHRADDILTAIRIAKEFGLSMTIDHGTEAHLVAEAVAKSGFPVLVGPSDPGKSKPEVRNKTLAAAALLHEAGIPICIITDAPVVALQQLALYAGLAVSEGLPMEEAWKAITVNPARVLGIDRRVGSLEPGKDADVVIWTKDPLVYIGGESWVTIVNGAIVYDGRRTGENAAD